MPAMPPLSTTPAELAAFSDVLLLLEDALPELPGLTPHERKRRLKMGDKSEAFVIRTLIAARQHGHLIPRGYDLEALEAQAALRPLLRVLRVRLQVLCERLSDAHMIAGGSLLRECMALYKTMKVHSTGEGIEELLGEMQRRFARPSKSNRQKAQEGSAVRAESEAAQTEAPFVKVLLEPLRPTPAHSPGSRTQPAANPAVPPRPPRASVPTSSAGPSAAAPVLRWRPPASAGDYPHSPPPLQRWSRFAAPADRSSPP